MLAVQEMEYNDGYLVCVPLIRCLLPENSLETQLPVHMREWAFWCLGTWLKSAPRQTLSASLEHEAVPPISYPPTSPTPTRMPPGGACPITTTVSKQKMRWLEGQWTAALSPTAIRERRAVQRERETALSSPRELPRGHEAHMGHSPVVGCSRPLWRQSCLLLGASPGNTGPWLNPRVVWSCLKGLAHERQRLAQPHLASCRLRLWAQEHCLPSLACCVCSMEPVYVV